MNRDGLIKFGKQLGALVVSFGIVFGFWAIGLFTADGRDWLPACIVFAVVLVALIAANAVLHILFLRRLQKMKPQAAHDFAQNIKTEIERDYSAAEKKVNMTLILAYCFAAFVLVIVAMLAFSIGRLGANIEFTKFLIEFAVLTVLMLGIWGVVYFFVAQEQSDPPEVDFILEESKYPQFYAVARRAAKTVGCDLPITLYDMTDGISIARHGRRVYINLDFAEAAILTREELFNVMLHEFAHAVNDFLRGGFYNRALARASYNERTRNRVVSVAHALLLSYVCDRIQFEVAFYDLISSRMVEQRADSMINKLGDKQVYADAVGKIDCFVQYRSMFRRETEYDFYEPEQPTKGYASLVVDTYNKYYEKYGEEWRRHTSIELPANVDSHPTARMRLEALGVTEYDPARRETDPEYLAEIKTLLDSRDTMIYDRMTKEEGYYAKWRRGEYTTRKDAIDGYFAAVANGEELSEPRLLRAARALFGLDDETALAILDGLISRDPNAPNANFVKGMILFNADDKACVDCFKITAKLPRLTDSAYDYIGRFALRIGDSELLQAYRAEVVDAVGSAEEREEQIEIGTDTILMQHDLDEKTVNELVEDLTHDIDGIKEIYVCKYIDRYDGVHYPVCVMPDFSKINNYDMLGDLMNGAISHINPRSDINDHMAYFMSERDRFAKVDGAKVYSAPDKTETVAEQ